MIVFLVNIIIILLVMKVLFKYMYPKPPKDFLPKEGEDTTIRVCDQCGHSLATYRGILIKDNPNQADEDKALFFCNEDHQAEFFAQSKNQPKFD